MPLTPIQLSAARHLAYYTKERTRAKSLFEGLTSFNHESTDIFITSFLKSGTTLTQQLIYQLLCALNHVPDDPNGTNFENISQVAPTLEFCHISGVEKPIHPVNPRIWKSHLYVNQFPFVPLTEGKFVYCVRNGLHVARSYIDFTLDWIIYQPRVEDPELRAELYRQFFIFYFLGMERGNEYTAFEYHKVPLTRGAWFEHVKGWIESEREVYYLIYEDLTTEMPRCVREVGEFLGLGDKLSEDVVQKVLKRCDREAMASDSKFLDTMVSEALQWNPEGGLRVRSEEMPGFKNVQLPNECLQLYEDQMEETFGERNYEKIIEMLRERNMQLLSIKKNKTLKNGGASSASNGSLCDVTGAGHEF